MAILDGFKLSNVQKNAHLSPVLKRRHKLVDSLHHQLMLAQATLDGKQYEVAVTRRYKDAETGIVKKVEGTRQVKPWWFVADSGKAMIQIKYGVRVLELAKGKSSIEIASPDKLVSTIELLKKAVLDGELDAQINSVAKHA